MRTQVALLSHSSPDQILNVIDELENAARTRLAFAAADYGLRTIIQLGMRYLGQGFDIAVEVPAGKPGGIFESRGWGSGRAKKESVSL